MSTTFSDPDDAALALRDRAMRDWHPRLAGAGVRVGMVFASNPDGGAVTHAGYPAVAAMKVVSLKDRLKKLYDAELVIDLSWWEEDGNTDAHRLALLDHELSHLDLRKWGSTAGGELWFSRDDLGRPKLRTVKGSWNAGDGFEKVVRRHGDFAVEFHNLRHCYLRAVAARDAGREEDALDTTDTTDNA